MKKQVKKMLVFLMLAVCTASAMTGMIAGTKDVVYGLSYEAGGSIWTPDTATFDDNGWHNATGVGAWSAGTNTHSGITDGYSIFKTKGSSNVFNNMELDLTDGSANLSFNATIPVTGSKFYLMLIPKAWFDGGRRVSADETDKIPVSMLVDIESEGKLKVGTTTKGFSSADNNAWPGLSQSTYYDVTIYVGTGTETDESFVMINNKKIVSTAKLSAFEVDTDGVKTYPAHFALFPKGDLAELEMSAPEMVETPVLPYELTLNTKEIKLGCGAESILTYTASDALNNNYTADQFTWSSSNEGVVTVNGDGKLTGVADGTSTIKISVATDWGEIFDTCTVNVYSYAPDSGWMTSISSKSWSVGISADSYSYNAETKETQFTTFNSSEAINCIPVDLSNGPIYFNYTVGLANDWLLFSFISESVFMNTKRVSNEYQQPISFYVRNEAVKPEVNKYYDVTSATTWSAVAQEDTSVVIYVGTGDTDRSFVSINGVKLYSKAVISDYENADGDYMAYLHLFGGNPRAVKISELKTGTAAILSDSDATISVGAEKTLTAEIVKSASAPAASIVWSTSNSGIVTVTNGVIKGIAKGEATVSAKVGDYTVVCSVEVTDIEVTGVALDKTTASMEVEDVLKLTATYSPSNATEDIDIEWSSSKTSVATVDENGNVTAVAAGTAVITVTCNGFSASCEITVTEKPVVQPDPENTGCGSAVNVGIFSFLNIGIVVLLLSAVGMFIVRKRQK